MAHHNVNWQIWQYASWTFALVATLGSLVFSEVMLLQPCVLCWYQRIAMYPLVVVLFVGIIRRDRAVGHYALPLAAAGLFVAGYHTLVDYGAIPAGLDICGAGVSCTSRQLEWAGFITIPLMSLTAFVLVTVCLALSLKGNRAQRD